MEGKESIEKIWTSCLRSGQQTRERTIKLSTRKHRRYPGKGKTRKEGIEEATCRPSFMYLLYLTDP
jgi:hypothetical protein